MLRLDVRRRKVYLPADIWTENKTWDNAFLAYGIYVAAINFLCIVLACHQLYVIFSAPKGFWAKGGLITQILVLGLTGCISKNSYFFSKRKVRVLEFGIDPHGVRGILGTILDAVMFEIPLILWLGAGFMLFLYWFLFSLHKILKKGSNCSN